jgi:hypothetical protein
MAKRGGDDEEKPKKLSTYTVKLDAEQMETLRGSSPPAGGNRRSSPTRATPTRAPAAT